MGNYWHEAFPADAAQHSIGTRPTIAVRGTREVEFGTISSEFLLACSQGPNSGSRPRPTAGRGEKF